MIPVVLIPVLVNLATKLIDKAFEKADAIPSSEKKKVVMDKIQLNKQKRETK